LASHVIQRAAYRLPHIGLPEAAVLLLVPPLAVALAAGAALAPLKLLLLAVAGAVVVTALLRIDLALLLVVATAPLEAAFASGPAGISVTKLAGGLCFAAFAAALVRSRRRLLVDPTYAIVLGILGLAALSATQAEEAGTAISTTVRYGSFAIVYIIVSEFGGDALLQRRIAWVLAGTSAIAAGLGIANYFNGSQEYAQLPYSNQNDFAFILATSLPLMFWLLGGKQVARLLVVPMIGLVFGGILLSLSRGTLVGLVAGLIFLLVTDRRRMQLAFVAAAVAFVAGALLVHSNPQRFQTALFAKEQIAQQNVTTRYEAWGAAARLASDHPLLGVGPGNFQFHYNALTGRPPGTLTLTVAHDAYLDIGAELGLIAMALFVLYLVVAYARLTVAVREGFGPPGYAQALRISLVIAAVCSIFLSEQYFLPFWLIGGLATAIWSTGRGLRADLTPAD
jgi:O-antigen ligase